MPNSNYNVKYDPKRNTREFNTYTEEYFAGADVTLSIGGKVATGISGLQYTIQEQQKPVYGYSSRTFDDMSVGNRIVVGTLKVPLVNTGEVTPVNTETNAIAIEVPKDPSWATEGNKAMEVGAATRNNAAMVKLDKASELEIKPERTSEGEKAMEKEALSSTVFNGDVKKVQVRLLALGFNVDINGFYDTKTKAAIKKYQSQNGLTSNGTLDYSTKLSILSLTAESKYKVITDSPTPVKTGPYTNAGMLIMLPKNSIVTLTTKYGDWVGSVLANDWMLVKTSSGTIGYVAKAALQAVL